MLGVHKTMRDKAARALGEMGMHRRPICIG